MEAQIIYSPLMANKHPFFGRTQELLDRIDSLDEKWYVEFWRIRYFFLGIEVYMTKKEVVKQSNGSTSHYRERMA